ncbi:hypothetical protein I5Q25_23575, partial [Serratia ureilytica]|uniref:hypothetical protein n=3 Tax=Serratia ureilytica TaxID=300181 RepID=UPI0018D653ED
NLTLRADDVHCLAANLPNQLRLLQPVLFLLLVEYRADAAIVGVIDRFCPAVSVLPCDWRLAVRVSFFGD